VLPESKDRNCDGARPGAVMRVGVVYWALDEELSSVVLETVASLGHETVEVFSDAPLPGGLDVVLALGPFGSMVPLATQMLARPVSQRPSLALWMTEQLWSPRLPTWLARALSEARSRAERFALRDAPSGSESIAWRWLTSRAFRFRYYGDLHWLRREGILTVLASPSKWVAEFLNERGFACMVAYIGSHPAWFAGLDVERDVPVLWLGSTGSARRRRTLGRLRDELHARGVDLLVIDGVERPPVFGRQRNELLSRTKIVVNLTRKPWDSNALRYYLSAPNGALIVSEPTLTHTPFVDRVHLVQVPHRQMAETICHYLADDEARRRIAEQAYRLVSTELSMANSVASILGRVARIRAEGLSQCPVRC
jgi:hypothetical protein